MRNIPEVSVLMAVHNGVPYLRESIDSILSQTFSDFEFIIINDASTDNTADMLSRYSDPRIRIINNEENLGLTKSLNKGLKEARGIYVARMDADDVALPRRLEIEKTFLDSRADIACVGGATIVIDKLGREVGAKLTLQDPELIRFRMIIANQLAHSSVMFRKSIVLENGGYDENFKHAQDYELWSRLIEHGHHVANICEPLIRYRYHSSSITQEIFSKDSAYAYASTVIRNNISRYMPLKDEEFSIFLKSFHQHQIGSFRQAMAVRDFLSKFKKAYLTKETVSPKNRREIKKYIALERQRAFQWYAKQRFGMLYKIIAVTRKFLIFPKK